jgi:hypothetical protein
MPKKGNTGSTWEELSGKPSSTTEGQAESSGMASKRSADGGKGEKRKWGGGQEEEGEGRSGGWGRNEDVKRELQGRLRLCYSHQQPIADAPTPPLSDASQVKPNVARPAE